MGFTKMTVVAFNGARGVAYDFLNNPFYFMIGDVVESDRRLIAEGCEVLYSPGSLIEIPSCSFSRYEDLTDTMEVI